MTRSPGDRALTASSTVVLCCSAGSNTIDLLDKRISQDTVAKAIRWTSYYRDWYDGLRDSTVRTRIRERIKRLAMGNPGSHRVLSRGLCELKIEIGPGFRVYYTEQTGDIVLLLAGGNKSTQKNDIRRAIAVIDEIGS